MHHIRNLELHSVSSVFAALAPDGREDAGSKMALASLLETMWADEFVDERDARFIDDHSAQHPARRYVLGGAAG